MFKGGFIGTFDNKAVVVQHKIYIDMKLPTWATVVGIIMLLFGGCGALSNVNKINTPNTLNEMSEVLEEINSEMSKEMGKVKEEIRSDTVESVEVIQDEISDVTPDSVEIAGYKTEVNKFDADDSAGIAMMEGLFGSVGNIMTFSDYYKVWIVRLGIIGLIASVLYALAGLLLIIGKSFSLNLVYGAIAVSLLSVIFQIVIITMDKESGLAAKSTNIGNYFMIMVNVVLLIIVLASDKSYFHEFDVIEE